jgi:hypothetical protein
MPRRADPTTIMPAPAVASVTSRAVKPHRALASCFGSVAACPQLFIADAVQRQCAAFRSRGDAFTVTYRVEVIVSLQVDGGALCAALKASVLADERDLAADGSDYPIVTSHFDRLVVAANNPSATAAESLTPLWPPSVAGALALRLRDGSVEAILPAPLLRHPSLTVRGAACVQVNTAYRESNVVTVLFELCLTGDRQGQSRHVLPIALHAAANTNAEASLRSKTTEQCLWCCLARPQAPRQPTVICANISGSAAFSSVSSPRQQSLPTPTTTPSWRQEKATVPLPGASNARRRVGLARWPSTSQPRPGTPATPRPSDGCFLAYPHTHRSHRTRDTQFKFTPDCVLDVFEITRAKVGKESGAL